MSFLYFFYFEEVVKTSCVSGFFSFTEKVFKFSLLILVYASNFLEVQSLNCANFWIDMHLEILRPDHILSNYDIYVICRTDLKPVNNLFIFSKLSSEKN